MKPIHFLLAVPALAMACTSNPKSPTESKGTAIADSSVNIGQSVAQPQRATDAEWLIVPGKSIGKVTLSENTDSVLTALGKPDRTDGAMGSALLTWMGKGADSTTRLSLFTQRDMGGPDKSISRVKQIRVTSPKFKTAKGVSTGAALADLSAHYSIKAVDQYKQLKVYDDLQHGIAFDVDSITNRCVAISIHTPFDRKAAHLNLR